MTVGMFSGGICSFLAMTRVKPDVLLFSDTGEEDPDLHRFNADASAYLNVPLITVSAGFTFDEMIERNHALPSNRMPFCSRELKTIPAKKWLSEHKDATRLVFGIDWTETHRVPRVEKLWPGFEILCPMTARPLLMKFMMIEECRNLGIEPPGLYASGFQHNNCGGGCVRQGHSGWRHLHRMRPETFNKWAKRESLIPGFSFCKDRRGGETRPITLLELVASQPELEPDWGGCGCFLEETP